MGFKRSAARMEKNRAADARGDGAQRPAATADRIVRSITSFALYGFPESHAASFALIAYASAWLKCHHPAAFFAAMLNCYPLGFYHPSTLVKDAERHGVVMPIDVTRSNWKCTIESGSGARSAARPQVRRGTARGNRRTNRARARDASVRFDRRLHRARRTQPPRTRRARLRGSLCGFRDGTAGRAMAGGGGRTRSARAFCRRRSGGGAVPLAGMARCRKPMPTTQPPD